jgi:hypothetical protein
MDLSGGFRGDGGPPSIAEVPIRFEWCGQGFEPGRKMTIAGDRQRLDGKPQMPEGPSLTRKESAGA